MKANNYGDFRVCVSQNGYTYAMIRCFEPNNQTDPVGRLHLARDH